MTEFAYLCTRWAHQIGSLLAFGSLGFILLTLIDHAKSLDGWRTRELRRCLFILAIAFVAGVGVLLAQLATLPASDLSTTQTLERLLENSRFGTIWALREGLLACAMVLVAVASVRPLSKHGQIVIPAAWFCVGASLVAAPFSGHSAAAEPAWPALSAHVVHLLAAGSWFGALPFLTSIAVVAASNTEARTGVSSALQRFSMLALPMMAVIVGSGLWIGVVHVETFPALLGTAYGYLLSGKVLLLVVVLVLAAKLRWRLLPNMQTSSSYATEFIHWVRVEWLIALAIAALAVWLAQTIPARHDDVAWRLPFRVSLQASWNTPWMKEISLLSTAIAFAGLAALALSVFTRRMRKAQATIGGTLFVTGSIAGIWAVSVEAYPGTYWKPTIPYQTISVAAGANLYKSQCVTCHGDSGHGDGPAAKSLSLPPADLTEPHTAYHTAGDIFWWLTYGKPPGAMPGFAHVLNEDDRWDLINYLRVLSAGYQARILTASVVPNRPWLGAIDFNYTDQTGRFETLKDHRENKVVLLILFTPGGSDARLETLARINGEIESAGAVIVAIPVDRNEVASDAFPFRIVDEGAYEAVITYSLLRRTLNDADARDQNPLPQHMELLIDRFGYARARWLPSQSDAWNNPDNLLRQITALAAEPKILEPPDDHVH